MSLTLSLPHIKAKPCPDIPTAELPALPDKLEARDSVEVRTIYHAVRWCGRQAIAERHPEVTPSTIDDMFQGAQHHYHDIAKHGVSHLEVSDPDAIRAVGLFSLQHIETPNFLANADMALASQMLAAAAKEEQLAHAS